MTLLNPYVIIGAILLVALVLVLGRPGLKADDPVEPPKWKPITLVTLGIVCFAAVLAFSTTRPAWTGLNRA